MSNPCYNDQTHTSCPRRHSGCAIDCPDWAKYSAERDKEYDRRAEAIQNNVLVHAAVNKRVKNREKWIMRERMAGTNFKN